MPKIFKVFHTTDAFCIVMPAEGAFDDEGPLTVFVVREGSAHNKGWWILDDYYSTNIREKYYRQMRKRIGDQLHALKALAPEFPGYRQAGAGGA